MNTHDQDKSVEDEYEYSPDPVINEAIKQANEENDIELSIRYGHKELGFRTKRKNVRTWDRYRFTKFIPEHERKYHRVCKIHQIDIKYNKHTSSVEMWNNAIKPGEKLGMVQEYELVKAMFDLMQYNGVKISRDRNKHSYRAYIPKHLIKIARLDRLATSPKESLPKFRPQNEPKSTKMIYNINNYNHQEVQKAIQRNMRLIKEWKEQNNVVGESNELS